MNRTIACKNWDSFQPRKLFDQSGRCIGVLQPRATQDALCGGVQKWSRPEKETRTDAAAES
jgi:hypothetical protein